MGKENVIVVDGANIAYTEQSQKGDPKVSNLVAVRSALEEKGYHPIIIIDASLVYEIDDERQLESMIEDQLVRQVPAGTDADYFVLKVADEYGAYVVTNDQYEPYRDRFPWIKDRRVPVMIVNGHVELYEPNLKQDKRSQD